jgi:hypothetical protein
MPNLWVESQDVGGMEDLDAGIASDAGPVEGEDFFDAMHLNGGY